MQIRKFTPSALGSHRSLISTASASHKRKKRKRSIKKSEKSKNLKNLFTNKIYTVVLPVLKNLNKKHTVRYGSTTSTVAASTANCAIDCRVVWWMGLGWDDGMGDGGCVGGRWEVGGRCIVYEVRGILVRLRWHTII